MSITCLSTFISVGPIKTRREQFLKFYLLEMERVLTSAGGSACTMQASCASLPSPEWTQPLSTSISGASAQQNGLVSQELMLADVHNTQSPCGGSTPGLFRIWDPGFCSPRGLKHSATYQPTAQTVRTAIIRNALQCL